MTKYIIEIIEHIENEIMPLLDHYSINNVEDIKSLTCYSETLLKELEKLDPRDFSPNVRSEFVLIKSSFSKLAKLDLFHGIRNIKIYDEYNNLFEKLKNCLSYYMGDKSYLKIKTFDFIHDIALRKIIERDYCELSAILLPDGAYKSAVILAGSILEAILYDQLTSDSSIKQKAISSKEAPKDDSGNIKDIDNGDWTLQYLINVAVAIEVLPKARAKTIDQILRDYRNFIHPKKEIKSKHSCTEAEATMAKGILDGIYNHLLDKYNKKLN